MSLEDVANIATVIMGIAALAVFIQIGLLRKQLKADHERSRREKSVDLLLDWTKTLKEDSSLARKIVEGIEGGQVRNLYNQEETRVPVKHKELLMKVLGADEKLEEENGYVILPGDKAAKLRWHVMTYLNILESILVAWQYSVVDREIIEHQFSYLFAPERGHSALEDFRIAAGGENSFPAIAVFANHIADKRRQVSRNKANVA